MKNSATLNDVAKLAGVSPITVSRVFNHPELVNKKTAEKVHKAVKQVGYVPNLLAGSLAARRSKLIAVFIPSILNRDYTETARFLIDKLEQEGYQVFLSETGHNEIDEENAIRAILARRPEAIVLTGTKHSVQTKRFLIASYIPIVEIWDISKTPLDIIVGFSHYQVGQNIAEYFLEKKYTNIAAIVAADYRAQLRLKGFIDTLKKQGFDHFISKTTNKASNIKVGRDGFKEIFQSGFKKGAIFCGSDTLAHGVLIEAKFQGLCVPKDIKIMGFGNQAFSEHIHPAISTVHVNRKAIGQKAAKALISRINNKELSENIINIPFEIIERKTTI